MTTGFRNSRWRRPPSWKIHFRLNRHYEKGTPGLLLPNENLTFVGLFLTFKGSLLSRALMLKQFPLQIGKVKKRVLHFGSKPRKGTCTMRKRKKILKKENKSHKTVTFHHCVEVPPCEPISTKFGAFVGLTNVITYTKIGFKISIGFFRPTGRKTSISL